MLGRGRTPIQKDLERHQEFMRIKEQMIDSGGTGLVFLGDAILDHWRDDPQHQVFDRFFGRYRPLNLGVSGDHTQHALWRVEHGELDRISPKVLVLLLGTGRASNISTSVPVFSMRPEQ